MSSEICLNLDRSKILLPGNGLNCSAGGSYTKNVRVRNMKYIITSKKSSGSGGIRTHASEETGA